MMNLTLYHAAQPGKVGLGLIGTFTVFTFVTLLVVDTLHVEFGMQRIVCLGFVGVNRGFVVNIFVC
jgi:hypothetical protein